MKKKLIVLLFALFVTLKFSFSQGGPLIDLIEKIYGVDLSNLYGYETGGETEETEPFRQFHYGTGFGLLGGGPLSHLFFGSGNRGRILSAAAEVDRNSQTTGVDPFRILEDIQIKCFQFFFKAPDRFFRRQYFVLVLCELFVRVL